MRNQRNSYGHMRTITSTISFLGFRRTIPHAHSNHKAQWLLRERERQPSNPLPNILWRGGGPLSPLPSTHPCHRTLSKPLPLLKFKGLGHYLVGNLVACSRTNFLGELLHLLQRYQLPSLESNKYKVKLWFTLKKISVDILAPKFWPHQTTPRDSRMLC